MIGVFYLNKKDKDSIALEKKIKAAKAYKNNVKRYNIISAAAIFIIIGLTACGLMFLPRPEFSELEKRELEKFPEFTPEKLFSGEYFGQIDLFFSDSVPFRESFVTFNSRLKKLMGISSPTFYGNVSVVADDEGNSLETDYETQTQTQSAPSEQTADETADDTAAETSAALKTTESKPLEVSDFSNNGIVVDGVKMYGEDAGVMLFGGSKKQGERYANIINMYKEALGDGVNVYNMVVPTSVEFYLPKKYSKFSSSEKDAIDYIYSCLSPNVLSIDAYSRIAEHTDEYIYLRTDHHWSPLGAYYAYTAFCDALGMEYHDISEYTEKTKEGFVGSLYGYTNDITLANAPETFRYYLPPEVSYSVETYNYATLAKNNGGALFHEYVEGANCYGVFLGADAIHTKVTTDVKNGRKIVVFKESYGNAFVPYLVNNFEEIYIIDIRYFGKNALNYIRKVGATDVLFIDNCFAANTSSLITHIENLFSSPTGSVVTSATELTSSSEESKTVSETKKQKNTEVPETKKSSDKTEKGSQTKKKSSVTTVPQEAEILS